MRERQEKLKGVSFFPWALVFLLAGFFLPASDLTLQVSLSLNEESWNNRSGLFPTEKLTLPIGAGWTSNLCAYVQETIELGGDVQTSGNPKPGITCMGSVFAF